MKEIIDLYHKLPDGMHALPDTLIRQIFDGTVFVGLGKYLGVQVMFNGNGEVVGLDTYNLITINKTGSIDYDPSHGFIYDGYVFEESSLTGARLTAIIESASIEWQQWKFTELEHPDIDFRTWKTHHRIPFDAATQRFIEEDALSARALIEKSLRH